jgi:hypothetical protein
MRGSIDALRKCRHQLIERIAELLDALVLELPRHLVEIDSDGCKMLEDLSRVVQVAFHRGGNDAARG